MKEKIGKLLCKLGFHKWQDPYHPFTLRCTRCPRIWCYGLEAVAIAERRYEEREKKRQEYLARNRHENK